MVDNLTKSQRSWVISQIKNSRTKPELRLRKPLKILNFVYQPKGIYGRPEFAKKRKNSNLY